MQLQVSNEFYLIIMRKYSKRDKIKSWYYFSLDDKACTFVGTAAYVPPEVLNSSPATVGWGVFSWKSKSLWFCYLVLLMTLFTRFLLIHWNRNDLWAIGCTLYQMLSGTSPFKDASEWLIFQRIIARDIRFPNYFSDKARDLIDRLLVRLNLQGSILDQSCSFCTT